MKLKFNNLVKNMTLLLFFVAMSGASFAQRTVTGTVTDGGDGEPLIGASVLVAGTSSGTVTDIDGTYSLSVPDGATELELSYTGYSTQRIAIGASNVIDVAMSAGTVLDEVVVIGYGAAKRSDLTGAVTSLESKDFNKGIVVNADQLIQGRMAGVSVINNSGQPGGEATIKVRGNNSIRAGANPLYVIDGVPLDGRSGKSPLLSTDIGDLPNSNPLNFLNPSDIESISVLKDASSAAIYGSRGANGVILVTTKKGRKQEPTVDFGISLGTSNILKKYEVLDGNQYRSALSDYDLAGGGGDGGDNVDAFDEILQNGLTQRYALSIGGGSDNGSYRVSFGLHDQEGIVKESGIKRYTAALNSNYEFMDNRVGIDVQFIAGHAREDIAPISTNAGFTGNLVGQALQWNPTIPLMSNGDFTTATNNSTSATVGATTINPLHLLSAYDEVANTTTIFGSISPYVNLTDNLTYRYRLGTTYSAGNTRGNIDGTVNVQNIEGLGWGGTSNTVLSTLMHSHTLNFNQDISDNVGLDFIVGYEYQNFDRRFQGFASRGFAVIDFENSNAIQNGATGNRIVLSSADPVSELQSYFGRANVNISDKYLLTATVRADGSTKFGDNNKYGVFPSFAARWNMHNEDFLSSSSTFDNLSLRVGWGQTGNQEFPSGASQELYDLLDNGGVQQLNAPNPDLRWETATTFNVGVDFAILDYAIAGTIEYFNRTTSDLLLDPFVSEPGPAVRAWQNIDGEVVNSGIELGVTAFVVDNSNAQVSISGNVAFIDNVFQNYTGAAIQAGQLFGQGSSGATVQVMENDQPLNAFYTREFTGIGDGGTSQYTNDGELTYLGDPNADVIMGLSLNGTFGDLSVGLNFNGAYGHQLFNNTAMSVIPIGNLGNRNIDANLVGSSPQESKANPIAASSRYIEDGDFTKLANATIGYNIGDLGNYIKNVRLSLTGQNLFVLTGYSGFDPEVNTVNLRNGVPSSGIEYIPYPSARSIVIGVNASF